jgi:hypothetical protein
MRRARSVHARLTAIIGLVIGIGLLLPMPVFAASPSGGLRADLDGRALDPVKVGRYYCQDFDYPDIHCFSTPAALEASVSPILSAASLSTATAVNYVIVYEFTSFQGAYMYMSEDYSILGWIGWNDRISSFKGLNSQSAVFWTDWLYSGTRFSYCCNVQYISLGSYDNTFSSVFRT